MRNTLIIALIFFIVGCQNQPKKAPIATMEIGAAIIGLASPIKLEADTTDIYLMDYFESVEEIDSLWFSDSFTVSFNSETGLVRVISEGTADPLSNMGIAMAGVKYAIPVYGSKKQFVQFEYTSPNDNVASVALKGNFNGWNPSASPLTFDGDKWTCNLLLDPALYEYLIVENGVEMRDPTNANWKDNGMGGKNSTLQIGNPNLKALKISTSEIDGDTIHINYPEALEAPQVYFENHLLGPENYSRKKGLLSIAIPKIDEASARNFMRVFACNGAMRTNDILIPLEGSQVLKSAEELTRTDQHAMRMYFILVDRFVNGDASNDQLVDDPEIKPIANYYGGDIQGVSAAVDSNYFSELNMNTVWLSPITQNPWTAYGLWDKGGIRSKFSGYHGYWPISSTKIDERFGSDAALKALIAKAHSKNENVILDYVANHVHELHPVYQQHPEWATDLYLPDGSMNTERWDEHRLTTWFDTFLPTLDLENPEVVSAMTDSALFWFENYDLDGFRHDATKHIPLEFWRMLTRKLKYDVALPQNRSIYQIGETYGNPELIGSYIGSGMLDAQFDFNMYDAAVSTFAKADGNFHELARVLSQGLSAYGSHHLMGNISGNQDRTRFISYADGSVKFDEDPKQAGWSRDIEIQGQIGYDRLAMLHAFNFTIPGIPVIYYGDEYGLPGANDPDNRRMMRFDDDLSELEQSTLATVKKLTGLRKNSMALVYGDTEIMSVEDHQFSYSRNYFDQTALVFFNNSDSVQTITVQVPRHIQLSGLAANFGAVFTVDGNVVTIRIEPSSFEVLSN